MIKIESEIISRFSFIPSEAWRLIHAESILMQLFIASKTMLFFFLQVELLLVYQKAKHNIRRRTMFRLSSVSLK